MPAAPLHSQAPQATVNSMNGPFFGPWYHTAPSIWGTQKGTIILTTTHIKAFGFGRIKAFSSAYIGI